MRRYTSSCYLGYIEIFYNNTYHNISAEIPVPSTPFTLYGGVGFTDSDSDDSDPDAGVEESKDDYVDESDSESDKSNS